MESDEKYIESHFGRNNPFAVPEGYLDGLAQSIIDSVGTESDKQVEPTLRVVAAKPAARPGWWHRYRMRVAVAACTAFIVAGITSYVAMSSAGVGNAKPVAAYGEHSNASQSACGMSDAEIDYTMLDNEAIYSLVASN